MNKVNNLTIVAPLNSPEAYRIATETFQSMYSKVTGETLRIITDREAADAASDLIVIGSDAVNHFTADCYLTKRINSFGIRYNTDEYALKSAEEGDRTLLFIAGGRGRSTIYAVYRYFELFAGCRYFWDGDIIPERKVLPISGIDIKESPRFKYRGIRYFAHRSLHRFQAEHWTFEDWKREIEWLLKKRLNLFMLRIGQDDLFQKAFPYIVPYPPAEGKLPEAAEGYDDRSLFWSLEHRGELRRKILKYAFDRDLMHPEDCGTMTHWYSRTPLSFLEKVRPKLLAQTTAGYNQSTGLVWDIRDDKNLENYFKLTEAHIQHYGRPEIFHTIGLAERKYSDDKDANLRLKLYVYRRIQAYLKHKYPNAPLLIASWDLWMYYTPDEVKELVSELDPDQSIILDYTSDTTRENNFTKWGIVGKFPWIFGIFGGYEPNSEFRGLYDLTGERLKIAKSDNMCCGMVYWPELSHGDTFMTEYFTQNAWESKVLSLDFLVEKFCRDRYRSFADEMHELWKIFMPIVSMRTWRAEPSSPQIAFDIFPLIILRAPFDVNPGKHAAPIRLAEENLENAVRILRMLVDISAVNNKDIYDELLRRDIYDIARTVLGRYVDYGIMKAEEIYSRIMTGKQDSAAKKMLISTLDKTLRLNQLLADLLGGHFDFSLYDSLERLKAEALVNPTFETTLKNNAENTYCRSYIYENAEYLYVPEMRILFDAVKSSLETGSINREEIKSRCALNRKKYFSLPLAEMRPKAHDLDSILTEAADIIEHFI